MTDSWEGIVFGLSALVVAAAMVIGHYRREWMRQKTLKRMDHREYWEVMRRRR
jgi:hypothetical protein